LVARSGEQGGPQERFPPQERESGVQFGPKPRAAGVVCGGSHRGFDRGGDDGAGEGADKVGDERQGGGDAVEQAPGWLPGQADGMAATLIGGEGGGELFRGDDVTHGHRVCDLGERYSGGVDPGHGQELPQREVPGYDDGEQHGGRCHPEEVGADKGSAQRQLVDQGTGG